MMRRLRLFATAFSMLFASTALAQSAKDFSTVRFYPAAGVGNYLAVDGANVGGHLATSYGAFFDYSADTLVIERPCDGIPNKATTCTNKETQFVHGTGLVHLLGSISLIDRVQISLDLPVGFTDSRPFGTQIAGGPALTIAPHQGFTFADARLAAKTRLYGEHDDSLRISGTAFGTLPTAMITSHGDCRDAGTCAFTGERGMQVGAYVISEFAIPEFRVAANVGAAYRPKRRFLTAEVGTEVLYAVAGQYNVTPLFHVKAEVAGTANLVGADDYPLEARGAFSYGQDFVVTLGGGGGLVADVGSPAYRIFAGAQWSPAVRDSDQDGIEDHADACPAEVEDRDQYMDEDGCPEPDNDGDGLPDKKDACDDEREDMDKYADDDGCPDLDNDADGVPDGYDSCEGEKEDQDGDRDEDGCPDLDSDRDGVRDERDLCPKDPEDTDGLGDDDGCPEEDFDGDTTKDVEDACPEASEWWNDILDQDGCPEEDADHDTVPDQVDRCADEAETLNGTADSDGCPDGEMVIVLRGQLLLPTALPEFEGDALRGAAGVADTVAAYVKRNHRRGKLRVVLVAPAEDSGAAGRASHLASAIRRRSGREVTSAHYPGSPVHFEIELLPPGWKELPRAQPKSPVPPSGIPAKAPAGQPPKPEQKP